MLFASGQLGATLSGEIPDDVEAQAILCFENIKAILANADMPGFSKKEQSRLSLLALAHRGKLEKVRSLVNTQEDIALIMALRLAALFYRSRSDAKLPAMQGRFSGTKFHLILAAGWLAQNPLTETALLEEEKQWKELGVSVQVVES